MKQVFLNGHLLELSPDTRLVLSKQSNNITKPDSIQVDFSQTFTIPFSKDNRAALEFAEEIPSTTTVPYRRLNAQVSSNGIEIVPNGKAELQRSTDQGYELQIYSGNINLFEVLGDKKLSQLDLSFFNHNWNLADISIYTTSFHNFTYPLIDIGQDLNLSAYPVKYMYPAVFAQLVWETIFKEAGFAFDFSYPPLFSKLLIPSTKLPEYSKEWTDARSYRGYVPQSAFETGDQSNQRDTITRTVPFTQTDVLPYFDSTNQNYDKTSLLYKADEAVVVDLTGDVFVFLRASIGAAQAKLTLLINDVVADQFHNDPDPENGEVVEHTLKTTDVEGRFNEMALSVHVTDYLLLPGDTVKLKVELKGNTTFNRWGYRLYHRWPSDNIGGTDITGNETTGSSAELRSRNSLTVQVKATFPEGGRVNLSNWLPDMSQKEFVKAIVKLFGLNMQTDTYENRIKFDLFDKVLTNKAVAKDWSRKIDYAKLPETVYTFGDFGQNSRFVWKKDDSVPAGLGDGLLKVDNETLELEKNVVEMPFAASETKTTALIPIYKREITEEGVQFSEQNIEPRLIVRGENKISLTIKENEATQNVQCYATYFLGPTKPYDLDFQRFLIPTYYAGLQGILKQVKFIRVDVQLTEQEYEELDQLVPVWVDKWGAYFYVNLISQWESGAQLCRVELIRLTEY